MKTPEIVTELRKDYIEVPAIIAQKATGVRITGKLIKSIIFSTDIAIINNNNADAVIAVYPFTPHPMITKAITEVASVPVFCGVGGGLTQGMRSANVALHAEFQGAAGVVLNAPTPNETITRVAKRVDIPVIITVVSEHTDVKEKLEAGAKMINVSGGAKTAAIVQKIRVKYPDLPIIATGGGSEESILETIEAGANVISYTPPTNAELFKTKMEHYREVENEKILNEK